MLWYYDKGVETRITNRGAQCEYCDSVPVAEMDREWRRHNAGRPCEAVRQDLVLAIGVAVEQKNPMPQIILARAASGYKVIDGHQRLGCGVDIYSISHAPATILIAPTQKLIDELSISENSRHGEKPNRVWLIQQALEHARRYSITDVGEVARIAGVGKPVIESEIRRGEVRELLESSGVADVDFKDMNGHVDQLHKLNRWPVALAKAFELTREGLTYEEVTELVDEVLKHPSTEKQLEAIDKFRLRPDVENSLLSKHTRRVPPSAKLIKELRAAYKVSKECEGITVYEKDKAEIAKQLSLVIGQCKKLKFIE